MLFSVEQEGFFSLKLAWEYGRVLGRSRKMTLLGKLLVFPGVYLLFAGVLAVLGVFLDLWKQETIEGPADFVELLTVALLMTLWGVSWCGINRFPTALVRLIKLRRAQEDCRFYPNHITRFKDSAYTDYAYPAVRSVYEGRRAFFLQMEGRQFLILQKSCFKTGAPAAFRRFMDEKGGRAVIRA